MPSRPPPGPLAPTQAASATKMREWQHKRISFKLCDLLRHSGPTCGVPVDADGYADMYKVLASWHMQELDATEDDIMYVVRTSNKTRFHVMYRKSQLLIRCNQGHSMNHVLSSRSLSCRL